MAVRTYPEGRKYRLKGRLRRRCKLCMLDQQRAYRAKKNALADEVMGG